jgi:hypothetical protein
MANEYPFFVEPMLKQHGKASVLLIKLLYVTWLYKKSDSFSAVLYCDPSFCILILWLREIFKCVRGLYGCTDRRLRHCSNSPIWKKRRERSLLTFSDVTLRVSRSLCLSLLFGTIVFEKDGGSHQCEP